MSKLSTLLSQFDGRKLGLDQLTAEFEKIAKAVLYGGHFLVNNDFSIYIHEVEFYFHSENTTESDIFDWAMYHRGNDIEYFPVGSLHPHRSGMDITFERRGSYRASFLIREYQFGNDIVTTPSYLGEDLIGYTGCILGDGPNIAWEDDQYDDSCTIIKQPRINVRAYDADGRPLSDECGNKIYDLRPWRFTKMKKV